MNNDGATKSAKEIMDVPAEDTALATTSKREFEKKGEGFKPILVEAEKMFERLGNFTKETAQKAFEYFQRRGGAIGNEIEDWIRAESEILLPVSVKVTETPEMINVLAAVPGFKPEDIEVSVKDNILIISGETELSEKREDENTVFSEFRSNKFCRKLSLPGEVEENKVTANLKDGVLKLALPKSPAKEAKHVPVNAT